MKVIPCETLWTENLGEITHYAVGKAGSRYFFSWSEWKWPLQNEDGQDEVPAGNIEDGTNGIHWFASLAEAIEDARGTIEALSDVHPEWAKEALYTLGATRLTTCEAAHMLGVTEMRIRKLCQDGRMGYKTRWSHDWIIPLRDVERFEREEVEVVDDGFECPKCGENRVDRLVNEDGHVTCESCNHEYNLNPIIVQNPWSGEMVEVMETEITQDKLDFMATLMDDEIRERIHTFEDCETPGAFFRKYADIVGPAEAGKIWFA